MCKSTEPLPTAETSGPLYGNVAGDGPTVGNLRGDKRDPLASVLGDLLKDLVQGVAIKMMARKAKVTPFEAALNTIGRLISDLSIGLEKERDGDRKVSRQLAADNASLLEDIAQAARNEISGFRIIVDALYDAQPVIADPEVSARVIELGAKVDRSIEKVEALVAEVYPVRDEQKVGG